MRDKLNRIIYPYAWVCVSEKLLDELMALLGPELGKARKYEELLPLTEYMKERAEKWDKVVEIAEYENKPDCKGCPLQKEKGCKIACGSASDIIKGIDALAGKETSHDRT